MDPHEFEILCKYSNTQYMRKSTIIYPVKMECGWFLWLKASVMICPYTTKNIFEIPPCANNVIFITEFVILVQNPLFYEVNNRVWKRLSAWRNFKNIFCAIWTYHNWSFKPKKSTAFHFDRVNDSWFSHILCVKKVFFIIDQQLCTNKSAISSSMRTK